MLLHKISGSRPGSIHHQRGQGNAEQLFIEGEDPLRLFAEGGIELSKQLPVELPAKGCGGILPRTDRLDELRDAGRQMRSVRESVQAEPPAANRPKE